jgi:hypothetical protein
MKYQAPAEGIMVHDDWGDTVRYKVACDCSDSDHDHQIWVEADDHSVSVTIYAVTQSDNWSGRRLDNFWYNVYNGICQRIKLAWSVFVLGRVKTEVTLIMTEQQAHNYAETLHRAQKNCKEIRKGAHR